MKGDKKMNLGERIVQYRTSKGLSQGDLAEMLNVSRQSVSKWENNAAVPDLDKIVKLSEIFEVSMDELVKGQFSEKKTVVQEEKNASTTSKENQLKKRHHLLATILLCMAFLIFLCCFLMNGALLGLLLATPFLSCGILCIVFSGSKNLGLWCAWTIYCLITIYLIWATGITWNTIFMSLYWTSSMNYMRLAVAWVLFISLLILIFKTVKRFSKASFSSLKSGAYTTAVSWCGYVGVRLIYRVIYNGLFKSIVLNGAVENYKWLTLSNTIFSLLKLPLFTVALITAVRLYRTIKANKSL